jgi:nitrogen fixation NifU-like protein
MLTENVAGKTIDDAKEIATEFRSMMEGGTEPDEDQFGDLMALKGVVKYPVRIKCAVLGWDVLQEALGQSSGQ